MSELRDKVISIHPGILVALGEVSFTLDMAFALRPAGSVCALPTISLGGVSTLGCSLASRSNLSFSMIASLKLCVWGVGAIALAV